MGDEKSPGKTNGGGYWNCLQLSRRLKGRQRRRRLLIFDSVTKSSVHSTVLKRDVQGCEDEQGMGTWDHFLDRNWLLPPPHLYPLLAKGSDTLRNRKGTRTTKDISSQVNYYTHINYSLRLELKVLVLGC